MVELSLQPDVKQTLELMLSPRLLQMLKVLNIPYPELVERINKEAEENVLLEVERCDEYVEFLRYLTSDKKIKKETDFSDFPGLENVSKVAQTLTEHLLEQLKLEDLDQKPMNIAKMIIENLGDNGFIKNYVEVRGQIMTELEVSRPTVDKILKIVQGFEPEGVAARSLKECLLIQIEAHNFENQALQEILTKVVEKHLDNLANKEFSKIAQDLGLQESGVTEIANFIKNNLTPNPASDFGQEPQHVIPSFAVEEAANGFKVTNLETHYGPKMNISNQYLKMLADPKTDQKTKDFLKEKLKIAKNLIGDFAKRSETLGKIVRKIVDSQQEFLLKGPTWLRPLEQKKLADEFGLHPSTISRTVAEKYIQTPQGLFPLRFLCPRGPKGVTVNRIKAMLAEIIEQEKKETPLTDKEITDLMKKKGTDLDRRTVAYYRKELKIPSSSERHK